jgi:hypothetical protein
MWSLLTDSLFIAGHQVRVVRLCMVFVGNPRMLMMVNSTNIKNSMDVDILITSISCISSNYL